MCQKSTSTSVKCSRNCHYEPRTFEQYSLLGRNVVYFVESLMFRRNISPPPSRSKSKSSKKQWKQASRWNLRTARRYNSEDILFIAIAVKTAVQTQNLFFSVHVSPKTVLTAPVLCQLLSTRLSSQECRVTNFVWEVYRTASSRASRSFSAPNACALPHGLCSFRCCAGKVSRKK
jgi:hypothetical protein